MNNPTLIIFDNSTGRVYSIQQGISTVPSGMTDCAIIVDAPDGFESVTVNPTTKTATFTLSEYEKTKAQVTYTAMMTDTLIDEEED